MTTKTLPQQARIVAGMIALGEHIAWGRDTELLIKLADQVEAITKERDALAAAGKLANAFIEWLAYGNCRADAGPIPTAAEVSAALRQAGVQ